MAWNPCVSKEGPLNDPGSYRGILLSDSFRQSIPRVDETQTSQYAASSAYPRASGWFAIATNCGEHPSVHRSRVGRLKCISTGTFFADLKAAFHHMIKVFTVKNQLTPELLTKFLGPRDFDHAQLFATLVQVCQGQPDDIPVGLRRMLHDLHCNT